MLDQRNNCKYGETNNDCDDDEVDIFRNVVGDDQDIHLRRKESNDGNKGPVARIFPISPNNINSKPGGSNSVRPRGTDINDEEEDRIDTVFGQSFPDYKGCPKAIENDGACPSALPKVFAFRANSLDETGFVFHLFRILRRDWFRSLLIQIQRHQFPSLHLN